jgi:hypothetical protein
MKVIQFVNVSDVAEVKNSTDPIITRDGAKLISVSVSGTGLASAVAGLLSTLLRASDGYPQDATIYLCVTAINSYTSETKLNAVVGISGVIDLEAKLKTLSGNLLGNQTPEKTNVNNDATGGLPEKTA